MATISKDYVAIPKSTWVSILSRIDVSELESEKVEFGVIELESLSQEQKERLNQAKQMKKNDFVNL